MLVASLGGIEGPIVEEGDSEWAPPAAGERPLDLRRGRGLSVTDFTASVSAHLLLLMVWSLPVSVEPFKSLQLPEFGLEPGRRAGSVQARSVQAELFHV